MAKYYELVIDGEAVMHLSIPSGVSNNSDMNEYFEKLNAALSSNPTIVPVDEIVPEGSTWDGISFTPPVG